MTLKKAKAELLTNISAFAGPGVPSVADALLIWDKQVIAPKTKRRVRQDALNLCKRLGLAPEEVVAHISNLNPRIRRLTCIGDKRRANIKNSVKTLLQVVPGGRSFKAEFTPEWAEMAGLIPDQYRLASVRCMMRYASAQDIQPEEFDDEASTGLLQALIDERLNGDPIITHQNAVRASNWLRANVSGWHVPHLTPPRYGNRYIKPWQDLPGWCFANASAFLDRSTTDDPFDLSRPMKAFRPATLKTYETLLRRFFSMADRVYPDFARERSWREVATFNFAEPVLKWGIARNGGKRGQVMAANIATLLAQIGQNPDGKSKLDPEEKAANDAVASDLLKLASRLRGVRGLSAKVRSRISPFKDEANLAKLFLFPFALEREVKRSRLRPRVLALHAQWAVALMILTFAPLRISTLVQIEDRHLRWSKSGNRGELTLELEAHMIKTGEPSTVPLPPECARMIALYCGKYRKLLFARETGFLFPSGRPDMHKGPGLLSTQLSKLIARRLGFTVNPHLYRHLVHIVILRRFPGAYVMISRVLLHRSLETAVTNYAHFDAEMSMKAYQQLIREVQSGPRAENTASAVEIAYNESEYRHAPRKSSR